MLAPAPRSACGSRVGVVWAALLSVCGCSDAPAVPELRLETWPEANALFDSDPRWVGGDGAYSVDLEDGRVLWLFGDSLIAQQPWQTQRAWFVRNSVAVQTGHDPTKALMRFYWREDAQRDGQPSSWAPEPAGGQWLWPGHGARLAEDSLLLFYELLGSPAGSCDEPEWCFENQGWTAILVRNPEQAPSAWELEPALLPERQSGRQLGEAVLVEADWIYVYATEEPRHALYLARFPRELAARGDLRRLAWWTGHGFSERGDAEALLTIGAPELSVEYSAEVGLYVMVLSAGFGPATIAVRVAERPQGPWSEPVDVLRPPEAFDPSAMVYAAKAHPELEGGDMIATYVPADVYLPRFARGNWR